MTTTQDPDEIRREIDRTRGRLSEDVDVLTESVRPSSIARRGTQRAGARASGLRDRVMGTAHDVSAAGSDQAHGAAEAVREAPAQVRDRARGNPLAAGAVALAAGWLVGSLLPASDAERRLASSAAEQAQPLVDEAKSVATESVQGLKEPAKDAAQSVVETAKEGAASVQDEGTSAAHDVRDEARRQGGGESPSPSA